VPTKFATFLLSVLLKVLHVMGSLSGSDSREFLVKTLMSTVYTVTAIDSDPT